MTRPVMVLFCISRSETDARLCCATNRIVPASRHGSNRVSWDKVFCIVNGLVYEYAQSIAHSDKSTVPCRVNCPVLSRFWIRFGGDFPPRLCGDRKQFRCRICTVIHTSIRREI